MWWLRYSPSCGVVPGDAPAPPPHAPQPAPAGGAAPAIEDGQQPDPAGGYAEPGDVECLAWLVMLFLATLFMGMAFLAIMNPPYWMPPDFGLGSTKAGKAASAAPSPALAPSPDGATDTITSRFAFCYLLLNTASFAVALITALMPFIEEARPTNYLRGMTHMMVFLYMTFTCSFILGVSNDSLVLGVALIILAIFSIVAYFGIRYLSKPAAN